MFKLMNYDEFLSEARKINLKRYDKRKDVDIDELYSDIINSIGDMDIYKSLVGYREYKDYFNDGQIGDIENKFSEIINLNLNNNKIVDISVLSKLVYLKYLGLSNNKIVNISSLSKLVNLKSLNLKNNPNLNMSEDQIKDVLSNKSCNIYV